MVTKRDIEKYIAFAKRRVLMRNEDSPTFHLSEVINQCEEFAQAKFGVSLAELLRPTMPLIYQDLSAASNEPDFPEAAGPDVTWEND